MSQGTKKYTVGQMAELCNISKKQLRYYDTNQILIPQYRDEQTNYRYYTENQIEEILLLQELKSLDFSLKDISKALGERQLNVLQQELENRLYSLRGEMENVQRKYNLTMDILLRVSKGVHETGRFDRERTPADIELVEFPARLVLSTRYISVWNAQNLFISRRAELLKLAEQQNVSVAGANMAIFPKDYLKQFSDAPEDEAGDFEVCMNIMNKDSSPPNSRILGPFRAVSTIFVGHYQHMHDTYLKLEAFAKEKGIRLCGTSVEEYMIGATMTKNPSDYVTRIYLPIEGSCVISHDNETDA